MYAYLCFLLDNNTSPLQLRLTGGSDKHGILEILYYEVWGYICHSYFSFNSANVACKRLGFPGAESVQDPRYYSTAPSTLWLSRVQCFGNETGLEQCSHLGFGNPESCGKQDFVGVSCIGMYIRMYNYLCLLYE